MVRWMRGAFEFDQPYKQTEKKMQVTGKISSSATVGMLRKVVQCKQKKRR